MTQKAERRSLAKYIKKFSTFASRQSKRKGEEDFKHKNVLLYLVFYFGIFNQKASNTIKKQEQTCKRPNKHKKEKIKQRKREKN